MLNLKSANPNETQVSNFYKEKFQTLFLKLNSFDVNGGLGHLRISTTCKTRQHGSCKKEFLVFN